MSNVQRSIAASVNGIPMLPSLADMPLASFSPFLSQTNGAPRTIDNFLNEVKCLFAAPLDPSIQLAISAKLQEQFKEKLQTSASCMLPSYNHTLPTGYEKGKYLALDVGGSTFRIALVSLTGKDSESSMKIVKMSSYRITNKVRALKGHNFFDWMAERIGETLSDPVVKKVQGESPLPMGLAWSFPIEQTSINTGILLEMGKGFHASVGLVGQDIGGLVNASCTRKKLNVLCYSIINDGAATLLSRAYVDPATRLSLVLGTGVNAATILPVAVFAKSKFGNRPQSWHDEAKQVVVNTELSMFGKGLLPTTRWDEHLNSAHMHPDYQPFEHMLGGRYLGEIVRLIIVEAIEQHNLFGGKYPGGITEPYSVEAGVLAVIDADESPDLNQAAEVLQKHHPLDQPPRTKDLRFVQQVCKLVAHRAAALLATGIHALWSLYCSSLALTPNSVGVVSMACNGSIIERYPGFRERCQASLDTLTRQSGCETRRVHLELAHESAIFGAAVAIAVVLPSIDT